MQHVRKLTPPQPSPRTACAPQTNMLQRPCRELISIRTPSLHRLSGTLWNTDACYTFRLGLGVASSAAAARA